MLPKTTKCVLFYFDTCGFSSGLSNLSNNWKSVFITRTIHILMAAFFTLFEIRLIVRLVLAERFVEGINFILQYSVALYAYYSIILDANIQQKKHRHFWKIVQQIDEFYFRQKDFTFKCLVMKFFCCFFISALAILIILVIGNPDDNDIVINYIVIIKICEARVFYCIFCVEMIQFQLKIIKTTLANQRIRCHLYKYIREYYYRVYEMMNLLNDIFGISQVAVVLFCFYFLLADLNWLYLHVTRRNDYLTVNTLNIT